MREVAVLTTNYWLRPTLVFSPDSRRIAFRHIDQKLVLWDVITRQTITNVPCFNPNMGPMGTAFSPDGRWLAFAENDRGTIAMLDVTNQVIARRWTGHQALVRALTFSPDGQSIASSSSDGTIKIWDTTTLVERTNHTARSRWLPCLAYLPDGSLLASSSGSSEIWIFDVRSGQRLTELRGHLRNANQLAFTPDSRQLLSASDDGTVRVWSMPPQPRHERSRPLPPAISTKWSTYGPAIAIAPDASAMITAFTNSHQFELWQPATLANRGLFQMPFTNASITGVAPGGKTIAFGSWDGRVDFWDAATKQTRHFAQAGTNDFERLTFSHDGQRLALGSDWGVRVWDVPGKRELHFFRSLGSQNHSSCMSLAFSRSGRHLMAGFFDGAIRVWDLADGGHEIVLLGHDFQVRGLALLHDERTLISSGKEVRVWDIIEGRELFQITPRPGMFFNLALSPDGRRLAAGGGDGLITLWDTTSWQEVATLKGHEDAVFHLAFSADGQTLVSASPERLRVWQAEAKVESQSLKQP